MTRGTSNFFRPTAHIGWISALLIAIAAQLIGMYDRLGNIEAARAARSSVSDERYTLMEHRIDRLQDELDRQREKPCLKN